MTNRKAPESAPRFRTSYDDITGLICTICRQHIWSEQRAQHERECPTKETTSEKA